MSRIITVSRGEKSFQAMVSGESEEINQKISKWLVSGPASELLTKIWKYFPQANPDISNGIFNVLNSTEKPEHLVNGGQYILEITREDNRITFVVHMKLSSVKQKLPYTDTYIDINILEAGNITNL